jgi:uncharacterized protein
MAIDTQELDLAGLRLSAGEGRRLALAIPIEPLVLAGQRYIAQPVPLTATLDASRMVGGGYALRLCFDCAISGPCMRCLKDASPEVEVQAREVNRPGEGEELSSPYVEGEILDMATWAHDALALALPTKILCRPDCAGLCPVCAADLNELEGAHRHSSPPDPRWAKLDELRHG